MNYWHMLVTGVEAGLVCGAMEVDSCIDHMHGYTIGQIPLDRYTIGQIYHWTDIPLDRYTIGQTHTLEAHETIGHEQIGHG